MNRKPTDGKGLSQHKIAASDLLQKRIDEAKRGFPEDKPGKLWFAGVDSASNTGVILVVQNNAGMYIYERPNDVARLYVGSLDKMELVHFPAERAFNLLRRGIRVIGYIIGPNGEKVEHIVGFSTTEGESAILNWSTRPGISRKLTSVNTEF